MAHIRKEALALAQLLSFEFELLFVSALILKD